MLRRSTNCRDLCCHLQLPERLQKLPLEQFLAEVETWVDEEYAMAQVAGDRLLATDKAKITTKLVEYSGVPELFVEQSNLRIDDGQYHKELLRSDRRTVGRLDSRYVGIDRTASGAESEFDPANSAVSPAFAACFNEYIRTELGYETDAKYYILGGFPGFAWNCASVISTHSRRVCARLLTLPLTMPSRRLLRSL